MGYLTSAEKILVSTFFEETSKEFFSFLYTIERFLRIQIML